MYIKMHKQATAAARVFTAMAAAAVMGGCAMKGDIRMLQDEMRTEMAAIAARQDSLITQLRAQASSTQDTLRTQADQMFEFRGDINQALRSMMQSLQRLEALAGENQRGIAQLRDQVAGARLNPVSMPPAGVTDPLAPGGGSEQLIAGTGNPDQLWDAAFGQYDRGSFRSATEAFQQFLEQYPDDERAIEAHFYLGDMFEQQDRPEEAIDEFQQIRSLSPTHERVPYALYRIANLQVDLGDEDEAKATLEIIMNTYSGHPMAMLARDLLAEIGP